MIIQQLLNYLMKSLSIAFTSESKYKRKKTYTINTIYQSILYELRLDFNPYLKYPSVRVSFQLKNYQELKRNL